ncbi:hypothetical protein GCM10007978_45060 [Shewanella hanedai]|uniref:Uncharacterized protein n=1 Tax=Shewanella hanedai TaxID=25 RepID=A0A553JH60_SHEHA|nr:hypothetical protein [Shewanella hanedai]TRY11782.1 hypothetical protein FN961_23310 [Shewanella hanedai]GGJ02559.1 hypothetical protein GCM10007978_45060 [Shewanella hanedai]
MESSANRAILLHEKLSSSDTFLLLSGVFLYTDAFLSIFHQVSLYDVGFSWYKNNFALSDMVTYIFGFSFLYGALIPFTLWLIDFYLMPKSMATSVKFEGRIRLEVLKRDAIVEGNSAAYKHFENSASELEKIETKRRYVLAIILCFLALVVSIPLSSDQGVIQSIWARASADGLVPTFIRFSLFGLSMWFLGIIMHTTDHYTNDETISNYTERLESKWISEVSSKLLDKDKLYEHLNETLNGFNSFGTKVSYDHSNESHKFCRKHGLINNENEFKLTEKGKFFSKYRDLNQN